MKPIVRNVLAVALGIIVGAAVNMAIVTLGPLAIPPPEAVDPNDPESIMTHIHLYSVWQMMPALLAHALGTLAGAFVTGWVAAKSKVALGLAIGAFFLTGGAAMVAMIPATPLWFALTDLALYLPLGLLGGWLGKKMDKKAAVEVFYP